ncbi:MAG: ATP synthase F1 subunit epsilon [Bdellovibrionota bacterium]
MTEGSFQLSIVTPERSILKETLVESVVLPGEMGQFNILPGHTNFVTCLKNGVFGYRVKGEWNIAFLSGGFTQVFGGNVSVLAETVEMAQELDMARAELELTSLTAKLKTTPAGSDEYKVISAGIEQAGARIRAAQKKLH